MSSLLRPSDAVHYDAGNDATVTEAVRVARLAAYKYRRDRIPYSKQCAPDTSSCKKPKDLSDLLKLNIPLDTLAQVLKREETFRMSPQLQELYDEFLHPPPCIEGELQTRSLEEHGLCRCYLNRYWRTSQHVDKTAHPDLWNSVVYLRYFDRYLEDWQVPVKERHQDIPMIPLYPTIFDNNHEDSVADDSVPDDSVPADDTQRKKLREHTPPPVVDMIAQYHTQGRPLVIVSGSQS